MKQNTTPKKHDSTPTTPMALRMAGIAALAGIVYIHAEDVRDKFEEVPYLGVGYVLLMAACALAAIMLLVPRGAWQRRGWQLGGLTAAATLIGYTLTRTGGSAAGNG